MCEQEQASQFRHDVQFHEPTVTDGSDEDTVYTRIKLDGRAEFAVTCAEVDQNGTDTHLDSKISERLREEIA
jgi:hypothetical protein